MDENLVDNPTIIRPNDGDPEEQVSVSWPPGNDEITLSVTQRLADGRLVTATQRLDRAQVRSLRNALRQFLEDIDTEIRSRGA
jgi:hypothetical protein